MTESDQTTNETTEETEELAEETTEEVEASEVADDIDVSAAVTDQYETAEIMLSGIEKNTMGFTNPRLAIGDIRELKRDIMEHGLINPLLVHEEPTLDSNGEPVLDSDGEPTARYLLIGGYRRIACIEEIRQEMRDQVGDDSELLYESVRCTIHTGPLDEVLEIAFTDNDKGKPLSYADRAKAVAQLTVQYGSQQIAMERLSLSQSSVSNLCSIYNGCVTEVFEALRAETITQKQAVLISKITVPDEDGNNVPDSAGQIAKMEEILNPSTATPTEPRTRTIRTKGEIEEMANLIEAEDEIDPGRKRVILDVVAWYQTRIDLDTLILGTTEATEEEEDGEVAEDEEVLETEGEETEEETEEETSATTTRRVQAES